MSWLRTLFHHLRPTVRATGMVRRVFKFFLSFGWTNFLATGVFDGAEFNGDKIGPPPHLIHPQSEEVYHKDPHFDTRPRFSDPASAAHQKETKHNLSNMSRTEMTALLVMSIHRNSGGAEHSRFREFR